MGQRSELLIVDYGFNTASVFSSIPKLRKNDRFLRLDQLNKNSIVIFEGGADIDPALYGESRAPEVGYVNNQRDQNEARIFRRALDVGAAVVGICRGAQLINVMLGGKLFQHVTGHADGSHSVFIPTKKEVPRHFQDEVINVTSCHHQMLDLSSFRDSDYVDLGHTEIPRSSQYINGSGTTEFVPEFEPEFVLYPNNNCLAIQGHPEYTRTTSIFSLYCRELVLKHLINF